MNRNNKAFTLIELIVVMAIIAVLVLLAAPRFLGYTKDANVTAMEQDTKVLSDAAEMYYIDTGEWPKTDKIIDHRLGGVDGLYHLDEANLVDSIKNIKGDYDDYGIVVDGKYAGQVFHLDGLEDKDGNMSNSHVSINRGIYIDEEIDSLIMEGHVPISNVDELNALRNSIKQTFGQGTKWENEYESGLDKQYIQVADINLSSIDNWIPIGDSSIPFKGVYDGGGYKINNLTIDNINMSNAGLFGVTNQATINNIGIINANIKGSSSTGSLIGYSTNFTKVNNTHALATVINGDYHIGGLIGNMSSGIVSNSFSTGEVCGFNNVGGLIGYVHHNSTVKRSYSKANANGSNSRVGGLIGINNGSSVVRDCFASGQVNGNRKVGGLIGYNIGEVNNSYSIGKVKGIEDYGGLVGLNVNDTNNNSYWDLNTSQQLSSSVGTSKTTTEMKGQSTYKDWDFESIWQINDGEYPTLRWQRR